MRPTFSEGRIGVGRLEERVWCRIVKWKARTLGGLGNPYVRSRRLFPN